MKKKRPGVRRASPLPAGSLLLRQRLLESGLDVASLDPDSVASTLRSRHPEYCRLKLRLFHQQVFDALASIRNPAPASAPSFHDHNTSSSNANSNSNSNSNSPTAASRKRLSRDNSASSSRATLKKPCCVKHDAYDGESDGSRATSTSTTESSDLDPDNPAYDVIESTLRDTYRYRSTQKHHDKLTAEKVEGGHDK